MEKDECIFCKIIKKQIPSDIVYEDDKVIGFKDISPEAPVHVVIIPKKHIADLNCLEKYESEIIGHIFMVARQIAKTLGVAEDGYRIVNNCGRQGGQTVGHLHFHLLGGRMLKWPPG
ncbi:MAG: histidine triad nucleotide-binding protein [Clostridium sp.]|uniref:histidine triad nucleotide-binding protein n=1 Tax=Clostridium sp. TaxID=1506 RepID=UPI003D6D62C2